MYGSVEGVNSLVPGVGIIDAVSVPSYDEVEGWLTEATVMIDGALAGAGYNITVDDSAFIYPALSAMTQLYAAATLLQAQGIDVNSGMEEARSEKMFDRFYKWLSLLGGGNLEALGVTVSLVPPRRRRFRSTQIRRIDGYSAVYEGSAIEYSYPSE